MRGHVGIVRPATPGLVTCRDSSDTRSTLHVKMTIAMLERGLKALPETERTQVISAALRELSPSTIKALERQVRRLAHHTCPKMSGSALGRPKTAKGLK